MKILLKDFLSRLTGISTPLFGLSWKPPNNQRKIAEQVITFLEGRRVIQIETGSSRNQPFRTNASYPQSSLISIEEIRRYLTKIMTKLPRQSALFKLLSEMRSACQECMPVLEDTLNERRSEWNVPSICDALSKLKSRMGWLIASLSIRYQIAIREDLIPFEIPNDWTIERMNEEKERPIRRRR